MFRHIILFNTTKPEAIEQICKHVMSLKNEISGLLDITYIKNLTNNAKGYNQMAIMDFIDRKNFTNWSNHPYHQEAINQLKEIAETLFFDYEYQFNINKAL